MSPLTLNKHWLATVLCRKVEWGIIIVKVDGNDVVDYLTQYSSEECHINQGICI